MDETFKIAVMFSCSALLLIVFIGVIIFVCTYHTGKYKSFKKPVKTTGTIDEVHIIRPEGPVSELTYDYFVITYSYTDNGGTRRTNKFNWRYKIGGAGDKIAVHYDSQNPENSLADCQLEYGKNLWWKVLLALALIIVPSVLVAIYFGK